MKSIILFLVGSLYLTISTATLLSCSKEVTPEIIDGPIIEPPPPEITDGETKENDRICSDLEHYGNSHYAKCMYDMEQALLDKKFKVYQKQIEELYK